MAIRVVELNHALELRVASSDWIMAEICAASLRIDSAACDSAKPSVLAKLPDLHVAEASSFHCDLMMAGLDSPQPGNHGVWTRNTFVTMLARSALCYQLLATDYQLVPTVSRNVELGSRSTYRPL